MPLNHLPYYLANILIHTSVYIFFILYSCESKLRFNLRKTIFVAAVYTVITCCMILLFFEREAPFPQYGMGAAVVTVIWAFFTIITGLLLIKVPLINMVFLIFITFNIQNSVILIADIIASFNALPRVFPFKHADYLLMTVAVLILYLPVMWYIYIGLHKKVIDVSADFKYLQYLCILPMSFFVFIRIGPFESLFSPSVSYKIGDLVSLVFINIVGILAYIVSLEMLLKTYETMTAKEQAGLMAKQLEMQKNEYERLVETNKSTARQRHDWRQHLLTISGLVRAKNYDVLEGYLSEYMEDLIADDVTPICGNAVVDVILRHFIALAREKGINVTTDVNIPDGIGISDLDLCVVFGNLVENAAEACSLQKTGRKFIKIKATIAGEQLFIFIQNSFSVVPRQSGGVFYSSKRDGKGIGISSVKSLVDTNGGNFIINIKDNVFTVDILLNI